MDQKIRFVFEGKRYSIPADAHETDLISLPDGRVLEVDGWIETKPPQPMELRLVTGVVATLEEEVPAS